MIPAGSGHARDVNRGGFHAGAGFAPGSPGRTYPWEQHIRRAEAVFDPREPEPVVRVDGIRVGSPGFRQILLDAVSAAGFPVDAGGPAPGGPGPSRSAREPGRTAQRQRGPGR